MSAAEDMGLAARCEMVLLVQAEFDGELDAAQAAGLASHRSGCGVCQAAAAQLAASRELLRDEPYEATPDAVRQRVMARLANAAPKTMSRPASARRPWWRPAGAGFGLGAACAAALALLLLSPVEQSLTDQIVADHIRALQPGHLEDVASSDQHTVKPWFDGRIDFAPPVRDFAAQGFPLKGGRLDYVAGRPVAALVYQRDKHVINLFVWPGSGAATSVPAAAERNGYNVVHWTQDGMTFWAVSDVELNQLRDFAQDWQKGSP